MRLRCAFSFAVFSLAIRSLSGAPIDLSPHPIVENQVEGGPVRCIKFAQGVRTISYYPPKDWNFAGGPETATLMLGGTSSVQAQISQQDGAPEPAFDEDGLKALRAQAQAYLGAATKDVKLLEELVHPLEIDRYKTMRYLFSGTLHAREYKFMVLFLFPPKQRLTFLLYSDAREFDAASELFFRSLYRFHWD